ncbi:MCE family protein [Haemophilus haemoglobinophilus]|nr:MCE family protein [Canicola haemoglobinophilus]
MTNKKLDNQPETLEQELKAKIKQTKRISPFWLLPFIALCICSILFFQIVKEQGETIKITFTNGDGLVAGKTQIRYQGLQIGVVKKVNFTDDLKKVEVSANIYPEAKRVLKENTKFWLVRPSASLAGISGIDALVSGNYITLQPGDGDTENEFIAETEGPLTQVNEGDLLIHLLADDLGSLSSGASVYFKKIPVGQIADYRFSKDQKKVEVDVIINKAYARFVKKDSHFWNISGINANVSLSGINIKADSLNAIVQGAVAFDSPTESPVAESNTQYTLYANIQAAKRGTEIKVIVPNVAGLNAGQTKVYSQDVQIGVLSELSAVENNEEILQGKLLVDPNMKYLFKTGSTLVLRNKKLSLGDLTDVKKVLRGEYIEVIAGTGESQTEFGVIKENELLLKQPNTLVINLTSPETYGITEGQPLYYNHQNIGEIVKIHAETEKVNFQVAIAEPYRQFIHQDTLFVAASNFDINLDLNGLRMEAANPEKWLQGGIRVIPGEKKQGSAKKEYPLYKDLTSAEMGITENVLNPSITLTSKNLPSISKGSLVLYRQYEVGKILDIRPTSSTFEVDVFVYPKYQHLLTEKSIFWVESAAQIDITPKGISIQATPFGRTLKGAISFDNSGAGKNKTLYDNELRAKSAGQILTFTADDATNLSKGMALRYMGLHIGEIEQISLTKENKIKATALIQANYMNMIAKEGSQFRIISPQISAGGIENIDSLLQPYIDVEIGKGTTKTNFNLQSSVPPTNKYGNGFPIILETNDATNISSGSPVMYRGVEVGTISKLELNQLGDRVLVHLLIAKKYQHLVRQNTEFWVSSGYGMELGFSGLSINTGTVQQLLKGGISFSTPSDKVVQPQAKANQRFLLQEKRPKSAENWNLGIVEE